MFEKATSMSFFNHVSRMGSGSPWNGRSTPGRGASLGTAYCVYCAIGEGSGFSQHVPVVSPKSGSRMFQHINGDTNGTNVFVRRSSCTSLSCRPEILDGPRLHSVPRFHRLKRLLLTSGTGHCPAMAGLAP